jgi:putative FmdB family regulatory protein
MNPGSYEKHAWYVRWRLTCLAAGHTSTLLFREELKMPTYEYACKSCAHEWETEQSIKDDPLKECPKCHQETAARQISRGTGFILKGGGWYSDLYSSSSNKPQASSSSSTEGGSSSDSSSSTSTSTASTPSGSSSGSSGSSAAPTTSGATS